MSLSDTLKIRWWLKEKHPKVNVYGEKLDRNGYSRSLFDTEDGKCYACGRITDTARHEIFDGADRQTSKAVGMWICVCPRCHREIHMDQEDMHKAGQALFEYHHSYEDFIALFGKNYL